MTGVRSIRQHSADGGLSLGAAMDDIAVRRFRRPEGIITPVVGGDGLIHVFASLSRGQVVEKAVERGATARRIATGDVSIDRPDAVSRYVVRGASDIVQLSFAPREGSAPGAGGSAPRLDEPEPGLETLAYRVAQAIWLGEAEDALFLSSVSARAHELVGRRAATLRGGLSPRSARLARELIEVRSRDPDGASLTLAELAAAVDLSVFHFTRAFRQTFSASPYRFALRQRLARARDLVAEGASDLRVIARRTGFSSVPHLTAAFGREIGVPPARFRRLLREVRRGG